MSAKNSRAAKAARRADRQSRQLKFNPDKQDNTIFHLIPSLQNPDSATRYYGQCQSCLLSGNVKAMTDGEITLLLDHKHRLEFLEQEQLDAIEEAARLYVENVRQMQAAAEEELAEEGE